MNKNFAASVIITGLLSYLFPAFFLWQWNPADWAIGNRVLMFLIWLLSLGVILLFRHDT